MVLKKKTDKHSSGFYLRVCICGLDSEMTAHFKSPVPLFSQNQNRFWFEASTQTGLASEHFVLSDQTTRIPLHATAHFSLGFLVAFFSLSLSLSGLLSFWALPIVWYSNEHNVSDSASVSVLR
jgi:hypothetical protein